MKLEWKDERILAIIRRNAIQASQHKVNDMNNMNDQIYWIALKNIPRLGPIKIKKLLEIFGSAKKILDASEENLIFIKGIDRGIMDSIKNKNKLIEEAEIEFKNCQKKGISVINISDPLYPFLLKEIADPPVILYLKGNINFKDYNSIGVIGTREPDNYGKKIAARISEQLSLLNFTIVSGMARGIDSIAHRSAIIAGGRTIGVMGCGLDIIYPPENRKLFEEIIKSGAVISEFPPGTEPAAVNFPRRNRIISGMSRGILVIQAKEKSGTFHTVNSALEQGREVYAIPGPIDSELSRGTNGLIKEGAKLVENVQDIIDELGPVVESPSPIKEKVGQLDIFSPIKEEVETVESHSSIKEENIKSISLLSEEEKEIYTIILEKNGIIIDEIIRKSSIPSGKVSSLLSILEIKGYIKKMSGNMFVSL